MIISRMHSQTAPKYATKGNTSKRRVLIYLHLQKEIAAITYYGRHVDVLCGSVSRKRNEKKKIKIECCIGLPWPKRIACACCT